MARDRRIAKEAHRWSSSPSLEGRTTEAPSLPTACAIATSWIRLTGDGFDCLAKRNNASLTPPTVVGRNACDSERVLAKRDSQDFEVMSEAGNTARKVRLPIFYHAVGPDYLHHQGAGHNLIASEQSSICDSWCAGMGSTAQAQYRHTSIANE